jgi:hypothetical protein
MELPVQEKSSRKPARFSNGFWLTAFWLTENGCQE